MCDVEHFQFSKPIVTVCHNARYPELYTLFQDLVDSLEGTPDKNILTVVCTGAWLCSHDGTVSISRNMLEIFVRDPVVQA